MSWVLNGLLAVIAGVFGFFALPAAATPITSVGLSCDNGHTYRLQPSYNTLQGDLVTGYLLRGNRHTAHLRLVPMEIGYRYAGHGIWLDGIDNEAVLNFGLFHQTRCAVSKS